MKIRIAGFKGAMPRLNPRLLPNEAAQIAKNVRLEDGALVALNDSTLFETLAAPAETIFRRPDYSWLSWPTEVNAANGPVARARTYFTGDGVPKVLFGSGTGTVIPLALARPAGALVIAVDSGTLDPDTAEKVFYTYTYVTTLDEESQPAPLSNALLCSTLQIITMSGVTAAPAGREIDRIRIYRSQTDALGVTQLYFVSENTIAGYTEPHLHDPVDFSPNSLIPSQFYDPPVDDLEGLCAGANGMMVAFRERTLYFCEPYIPHAWPQIYSLQFDYEIVGVASIGASFAVLTNGTPYIVQGTHPASMIQTKMEQSLPCKSRKGIVDLGFAVIYPSPEGLVAITNGGAKLITQNLYTRLEWNALNPETIVAGQHTGRYVFSYLPDGVTDRRTFILDLAGENPWLVESDETFSAAFTELRNGRLFMLINDVEIRRWDGPLQPPKTMVWRSRIYHLAGPVNFGAFLLETDTYDGSGDCVIRVYADGVLTTTVTKRNEVARLKSGFLALRWEIEYEGTIPVTSLNIATTATELASQ